MNKVIRLDQFCSYFLLRFMQRHFLMPVVTANYYCILMNAVTKLTPDSLMPLYSVDCRQSKLKGINQRIFSGLLMQRLFP
jgi:hypothetical protein